MLTIYIYTCVTEEDELLSMYYKLFQLSSSIYHINSIYKVIIGAKKKIRIMIDCSDTSYN